MSKTCAVCGRAIKTGRKYCWEHRHTAQADSLRGDNMIKQATKSYLEFRLSKYILYKYGKIIGVLIGLISEILLIFFGPGNLPELVVVFGVIAIPIIVPLIHIFLINIFYRKKIDKDIALRIPEYIDFVKSYVSMEKEEREFKRSLLK